MLRIGCKNVEWQTVENQMSFAKDIPNKVEHLMKSGWTDDVFINHRILNTALKYLNTI